MKLFYIQDGFITKSKFKIFRFQIPKCFCFFFRTVSVKIWIVSNSILFPFHFQNCFKFIFRSISFRFQTRTILKVSISSLIFNFVSIEQFSRFFKPKTLIKKLVILTFLSYLTPKKSHKIIFSYDLVRFPETIL